MYLGWYPLSNASSSWLKWCFFRNSTSTRAKARFSGVGLFPGSAIGSLNSEATHCMVPPSILSLVANGIFLDETLTLDTPIGVVIIQCKHYSGRKLT